MLQASCCFEGRVMFCSGCGTPRPEAASFCAHCGQTAGPDTSLLPVAQPSRGVGRTAIICASLVVTAAVVAGAAVVIANNRSSPVKAVGGAASTGGPTVTPAATATASGFSELYKQDALGVIRIETTACNAGGVGSGFLVAPDLIATVAHVVTGAVSVVLRQGGTTTTGTVVGLDPTHELALIRSSVPFPGHVFTMADATPDVATDVAAIGYPLAGPESLTKGTVSGLDRPIQTDSANLTGLIQTDASINFGNSGGPLLIADGTVVGLVEAKTRDASNIGYAIPTSTAKAQIMRWQAAPTPVTPARSCSSPVGPQGLAATITDSSNSPEGPQLLQAFQTYATGINTGDYASAYAILSPSAQAKTSEQTFAQGDASSYIVTLDILSATSTGTGQDSVEVQFTSVQDPVQGGHGQSCSAWQLTYTMINQGAGWLIDRAAAHQGSPTAC